MSWCSRCIANGVNAYRFTTCVSDVVKMYRIVNRDLSVVKSVSIALNSLGKIEETLVKKVNAMLPNILTTKYYFAVR